MSLKPDEGRLLQREPLAEGCLLGIGPLMAPEGVPRAKGLVSRRTHAILPLLGQKVPSTFLPSGSGGV